MPRRLYTSVTHAFRGIAVVIRGERNFRIHCIALLMVIVLAAAVRLRAWEWALLVLVAGMVLVLELVNSAMERLLDLLKPRLHVYARDVKDVMAGATLVAAFVAVVVGCIVGVPYLVGR